MLNLRIKCAHCNAVQPIRKSDIKTDKKAQARLKEIEKLVKKVPEFVPKKFVPYKKTWFDKVNIFWFDTNASNNATHDLVQQIEGMDYFNSTVGALCRVATNLITTYWTCKLCGRKNKFEVK